MVEDAWSRLCRDLGIGDGRRDAVWRDIVTAYGEPQRHYHTLDHVAAVVADAEQLRSQFEEPNSALLALFFLDIIYDPARSDNEERSADMLRALLINDVDGPDMKLACWHIWATKAHQSNDLPDVNLVLDIDMAILGAPWPTYRAYAEDVYREYLPVYGAEAYAKGRVELFLKPTLLRDRLFLTEPFAVLEDQAHRNMSDEIALWSAGGFAGA